MPELQFLAFASGGSGEEWTEILLLLVVFGAIGGVLQVLSLLNPKDILRDGKATIGSYPRFLATVAIGTVSGAGGGIAYGAILALADKFDEPLEASDRLLIAGTALAAGFLGIWMIKRLAIQIDEEALRRLETRTEKRIVEEAASIGEYSDAIDIARDVLQKDTKGADRTLDGQRREALAKLEKVRPHSRHSRPLGIYLGRLYRQLGDLDSAIQVLSEVIEARKKERRVGVDLAALLYNRACYRNLLAGRTNDPRKAAELRSQAWEDLRECVRLSPADLDEARHDDDLVGLELAGARDFDDLARRAGA